MLDLPLFFHQLNVNRASEFFAADLLCAVVPPVPYFDRRLLGKSWWVPVLGLIIFGVSVALTKYAPVCGIWGQVTSWRDCSLCPEPVSWSRNS